MISNDVVITGIGLVSSLGEGVETHWQKLTAEPGRPVLDVERFAPFLVHPLPAIDWTAQIPKRDQRQMETWQRLGTYTAGLALEDAGIAAEDALRASMDMVVAAGGGERDLGVDVSILSAAQARNDHGVLLNEKLTTELRPTLFLAQLSNLLAGNISIVQKVTGSSRTFMGEEGSGISAIETAAARIRSGQSTHILVGAAYACEHEDMLLNYELGGYLQRNGWAPVWSRDKADGGGVVTGSGAAFLVLESAHHAAARGRRAYARLGRVAADRVRRSRDDLASAIEILAAAVGGAGAGTLVVSGASGAQAATRAEQAAFSSHHSALRGFSSAVGHLKEAQFPFALGLAALAASHGEAYPAFDLSEASFDGRPSRVLATTIGFHRYEGIAELLPAGDA